MNTTSISDDDYLSRISYAIEHEMMIELILSDKRLIGIPVEMDVTGIRPILLEVSEGNIIPIPMISIQDAQFIS